MSSYLYNDRLVRRWVREALELAGGYALTEAHLAELVNERCAVGVDLTTLRFAIEYNHGKGFLATAPIPDSDERGYVITPDGLAQNRID